MLIKILAVDDDHLIMELMERALKPYCSKFVKVTTLEAALKEVANDGFNLVLLDLRFTETDKIEAFHAIEKIKAHKCAVIVVSGLVDPNIEREAKDAGAVYFVRKDGSNFTDVLKTACDVAVLHLPHDSFKSDSFLEHIRALHDTVAA